MNVFFRPLLLSLMLGLLEAIRQAERPDGGRPAVRWVMRSPRDSQLARPERCWWWGESPLMN